MAYTVACPLMNRTFARNDRETTAALLREAGVARVFLALGTNCLAEPDRGEEIRLLRENRAFLKARGFEVGAWLWAFLYTLPADFVRMQAPDGRVSTMTVCPTDPAYRREMGLFLRELAAAGVDMIMFDDDYRYGFQDMGFGCVCGNHRAMIEETLGRPVTGDELRASLLAGGQNEASAPCSACAAWRPWPSTSSSRAVGSCTCTPPSSRPRTRRAPAKCSA